MCPGCHGVPPRPACSAQAGSRLSSELGLSHFQTGIVGFLMVFFGIWWAWVNFTWFASAYDVDDLPYRLLTFVQIVGVLILAAGVSSAFDHADFATITVGYVIMRIAMVGQWLRAASGDPAGRPVCLRYAAGISGTSDSRGETRVRDLSG